MEELWERFKIVVLAVILVNVINMVLTLNSEYKERLRNIESLSYETPTYNKRKENAPLYKLAVDHRRFKTYLVESRTRDGRPTPVYKKKTGNVRDSRKTNSG